MNSPASKIIDTEKILRYVEDMRKKYDCPNYGQNYIDAVETLRQCQALFLDDK